jgi:hypothetical protein
MSEVVAALLGVFVRLFGHAIELFVEAGQAAVRGPRRRLWTPMWLGLFAGLVALSTLAPPWNCWLLGGGLVTGVAAGVCWQRARAGRERAAEM